MRNSQYDVMKAYYLGRVIQSEDKATIDELVSQGIMTTGLRKKVIGENKGIIFSIYLPSAYLTNSGKGLYRRESIRRSPLLRWLSTPNI
jgi:hypothetical protein